MSNEYEDKATWQLFAEGKTKGVFQLESNLGKSWSKKLAPNNIESKSFDDARQTSIFCFHPKK